MVATLRRRIAQSQHDRTSRHETGLHSKLNLSSDPDNPILYALGPQLIASSSAGYLPTLLPSDCVSAASFCAIGFQCCTILKDEMTLKGFLVHIPQGDCNKIWYMAQISKLRGLLV